MMRTSSQNLIVRHGLGQRVTELPAVRLFMESDGDKRPPLRVVMVDDDSVFCTLTNHWARKFGVTIKLCSSGTELVELLEQGHADALILDQFIGDERGLELASLLDSVPVVMISGTVRASDWTYLPKNVCAVVHKKFGIPTILNTAIAVAANQGSPKTGRSPPFGTE